MKTKVIKNDETEKEKKAKEDNEDASLKKVKNVKAIRWLRYAFYPIAIIYMELVFHFSVFGSADINIAYPVLFAIAYGGLITIPILMLRGRTLKILSFILFIPFWFFFNLQLVYHQIFKTFVSVYSVTQNAGDVTEFWKEALNGIIRSIPGILLLSVPFVILAVLYHKKRMSSVESEKGKTVVIFAVTVILFYIFVTKGTITLTGDNPHEANDLYYTDFILDLGVEKLGVTASTVLDFKQVFFTGNDIDGDMEPVFVVLATPIPTPQISDIPQISVTPEISDIPQTGDTSEPGMTGVPQDKATPTPTLTPTPTPIPVDTSPNILDIDFTKLSETEKDDGIAKLHKYMASAVPTKKNEYTGLFEGFNLIMLTAEGYSPWAVDEELTPTLYKLVNSGFVFNNFYTPIWYTSTSDGEYVACTSLIPYNTNSFKRSSGNSMPLCFGNVFSKLGYTTKAWHNHSYTYYGRNKSHPNIGYDFKAKGHGLDITPTWPESDLEMMELTIPEFINDDKFHVYYMTVSGHLEYNFSGNSMASKHKEDTASLPYSEHCRAYIACNMELDLALGYLIEQLEAAGIADKTVIALSADHYPYGLEQTEIDELAGHEVDQTFELYKNNFILWSGAVKEPIVIDKYCSSLDIVPTLCNLFGLEYDSRLYMGQDILSDAPPIVMFSNQSFITDRCSYNSKTHEVIPFGDEMPDKEYIDNVIAYVKNKFNVSHSILLKDYYKYIEDYLPVQQIN